MKKAALSILLLFVLSAAYSKTIPLPASTNDNGEIVVVNTKGEVEDRIHLDNATDAGLKVTIKGQYKKNEKIVTVATDFIGAHDSKYCATQYEDDLDDFSSFIISIEDGKILSYTAETAWSDLYFYINETDVKPIQAQNNQPAYSAADELLKWKELLDKGAITQEEFDAKKKQLLGLQIQFFFSQCSKRNSLLPLVYMI